VFCLFFKAKLFFSTLEESKETVGLTSISEYMLLAQVVFTDNVFSCCVSSNGPWEYHFTIF